MEIRKDLTKVLGGVLVGGMLLSGGMAFAGDTLDTVTGKDSGKMPFFGQGAKHGGVIGKGKFMGGRGMLPQEISEQLVKDGVITQAKADENEQRQQQLSDSLKALIEKGTITQEQADSILKRCEDAKKEREAFLAKMDNMTLKEIRQYKIEAKGNMQNPMKQLVSDGVITQEQLEAIQKAKIDNAQKQNQQRISDSLKALAGKGTITQEQADKVLKKINDCQKEREVLIEKIKSMTQEERRQYMQDNRQTRQDPVSQLVTDGTITQEQADAIGEVLPHKGFGGFEGKKGLGGHKGGRR